MNNNTTTDNNINAKMPSLGGDYQDKLKRKDSYQPD